MSHSRKDGRHRGGHVDHQCTEIWSPRCPKANMMRKANPRSGLGAKALTHRYERRLAAREIRDALTSCSLPNDSTVGATEDASDTTADTPPAPASPFP